MAERVVSPGVFTRERDLSFLEEGVANIGGAFVGVTQRGPAFVPVLVSGQQEFENRFGKPDEYSYLGYTVKNYLQEAAQATVVRVLGLDGYSGSDFTSAKLVANDGGEERVVAVFHPTVDGVSLVSASVDDSNLSSLTVVLSGSSGLSTFTAVNPSGSSTSNVQDTIGTAVNGTAAGYVYSYFPAAIDTSLGGIVPTSFSLVTASALVDFENTQYTNASTPWIRSQQIGGNRFDLFKVHTLADGSNSNTDVKISLQSIKYRVADGTYGTFTLLVRRGNDTDTDVEVLEQWDNLTLDPVSPNYIARRIGNSVPTTDGITGETYYQGDFPNKSEFIRVQVGADVANGGVPETTLPYGFGPVTNPFVLGTEVSSPAQLINTAWVSASVDSGYKSGAVRDTRRFYGFDYSNTNDHNLSFLRPLPAGAVSASYIPTSASATVVQEFSLDNTPPKEVDGVNLDITDASHVTYRKFTVPLQGGFDGFEPNRLRAMGADITAANTQGFNCATATSEGTRAFKKGIDQISNPEAWDINLLTVPGVNYEQHPNVCSHAITVCEDRQDTFFIMDLASYDATVATATTTANNIDSSYAGAWFPWVRIQNSGNSKLLWAPPSVVLPEVFAFSDSVSAEWFAPAGLNRGGIPGAAGVSSRLNRTNRDELYENKVNPIAQFPGQGIVAFGQKTLQTKPSALDRINVRRMVLTVKKFIASSSRYLLFEQNTEATRQRFLNIVNPYLASVQERQGLYAFRVVMDETNNTPDVIDRNQLVGQIFLQPTRTAEFIILDFNILPTGATFAGS